MNVKLNIVFSIEYILAITIQKACYSTFIPRPIGIIY